MRSILLVSITAPVVQNKTCSVNKHLSVISSNNSSRPSLIISTWIRMMACNYLDMCLRGFRSCIIGLGTLLPQLRWSSSIVSNLLKYGSTKIWRSHVTYRTSIVPKASSRKITSSGKWSNSSMPWEIPMILCSVIQDAFRDSSSVFKPLFVIYQTSRLSFQTKR